MLIHLLLLKLNSMTLTPFSLSIHFVKLKDFNIEHFEKWKKQINSYGYTTNHKNHLFKFFKELFTKKIAIE